MTSPRKFFTVFYVRLEKSKPGANSYFSLLAIIPSPPPFSLLPFLQHGKNRVRRFAAFLFAAHLHVDIDRKRKQHARYRRTLLFFSFLFLPFFSVPSFLLFLLFFFFKWTQFDSGSNRLSRRNTPLSRVSTIRTAKLGKGASWNPVGQHSLFLATRAFAIIVSIGIPRKY